MIFLRLLQAQPPWSRHECFKLNVSSKTTSRMAFNSRSTRSLPRLEITIVLRQASKRERAQLDLHCLAHEATAHGVSGTNMGHHLSLRILQSREVHCSNRLQLRPQMSISKPLSSKLHAAGIWDLTLERQGFCAAMLQQTRSPSWPSRAFPYVCRYASPLLLCRSQPVAPNLWHP